MSMSHGLYSCILAGTLALSGAALYAYSLLLDPVEGDLVRIGRLSAADYGFNRPQPRFEDSGLSWGPYERYHDIVVLGDSFSSLPRAGSWADHLRDASGASVHVIDAERSHALLLGSPAFLAEPPKIVIFQTVERRLKDVAALLPSDACPDDGRSRGESRGASPVPELQLAPLRGATRLHSRPGRRRPWQGDIRQAKDHLAARLLRRWGRGPRGVVERRLKAPAFSCAKGSSLLVYRDDETKLVWGKADLAGLACGLESLRRAVERNGRTLFLVLILPDKLSAYAELIADPAERARAAWTPPPLDGLPLVPADRALREEIRSGTLDVYLPDDTHLGSAGARAAAEAVLRDLGRRRAASGRGGP